MADRLVTVATFYSPIEANLFKMRLDENGIQAGLMGEGTVAVLGIYSGLGNRIEVQVNEWDADRAVRLLEQFEEESKEPDEDELPPENLADPPPSDAIRPVLHSDEKSTHIRASAPATPGQAEADKVQAHDESHPASEALATCPACNSKVDAGRDTCHWCGATLIDAPNEDDQKLSADDEQEGALVDDASLRSLETAEGDARCQRAFLLSIAGIILSMAGWLALAPCAGFAMIVIIPVCNGISLNIAFRALAQYEVGALGKLKACTAIAADAMALLFWVIFLVVLFLPLLAKLTG